jgi:hypothetical protein
MPVSARSLRWLIALVAIRAAAFAAPPPPEKAVTVAQLDQLIGQIKNENDAKAARELSNLRLLERAGFSRLASWESTLRGPRARRALLASVDASAFLAPPATEILSAAPPDEAERHQILAHVNEFVKQAAQKMPDFLATRETVSFEVTTKSRMESQGQTDLFGRMSKSKRSYLQALGPAEASGGPNAQLFWLGTTTQSVTYRDGKETSDAGGAIVGVKNPLAISSVGEFGQVLVNLFSEIATEDIAWDHWEDRGTGRIAVFHYSVPRERSRWSLTLSEDEAPDYPAHHGEFAVDTSSGAILRVSFIAQVHSFWQEEIGVVVESGPTQIGGRSYICALHSTAVVRLFDMFADLDRRPQPIPLQMTLNDVSFEDYRVFGSNSRVVTDAKDR